MFLCNGVICCSITLPLQSMGFPFKIEKLQQRGSSDCQKELGAEQGIDPLFLSRTLDSEDQLGHPPGGLKAPRPHLELGGQRADCPRDGLPPPALQSVQDPGSLVSSAE